MVHDVVVVGGGIFGLTAALELRRRGSTVVVIDAGTPPSERASSTDSSKVVRAGYGADLETMDLALEAIEGWRRWNEVWFDEPLFHETGVAMLTREALTEESFEAQSIAAVRSRNVAIERLDAGAIGARFGAFAADRFEDGYFNPVGGWADSAAVVRALAVRARRFGVRVMRGCEVLAISDSGVETPDGTVRAHSVVVAAGAWTPRLLPELGEALRPVAQPLFYYAPSDASPFTAPSLVPWGADIATSGFYGTPRSADGTVKVAHHGRGLRRDLSAPRTVDAAIHQRFADFIEQTLPQLGPPQCARLCFYCDSADGAFWITPHPRRPNIVVAAGGSGHAFKFAPLLGGWIADAVEQREAPIARFRWRERGAGHFADAARSDV